MPRLDSFQLDIRTGNAGGPEELHYSINGFALDFENANGSTKSGDVVKVTGSPQSFPHSLTLTGPSEGAWDIEGITATYTCAGEEPYTIELGAITLNDDSDLNIWYERPLPTFDV